MRHKEPISSQGSVGRYAIATMIIPTYKEAYANQRPVADEIFRRISNLDARQCERILEAAKGKASKERAVEIMKRIGIALKFQ